MLDKQALLDAARDKAGLDDFGGDDFHRPLDILLASLRDEANCNEMGRLRAEISITNALATRLQVEDYTRRHPDLLQQPVPTPVFIVGLPRTGTTALHHLCNQDPVNHTLRLWEGNHPVPPPEEASYTSDPRIALHQQGMDLMDQLMPEMKVAHLLDTEEPDECIMLFNRAMISVEFTSLFHLPTYAEWLYRQDLTELYGYHKRQLQLLQYRKRGLWVLKTPMHQLGLRAILHHYPDAIIVQTHRDPLEMVPSGASFCQILRKSCADDPDPRVAGADWIAMIRAYRGAFNAARRELETQHPGQFLDIEYSDLLADPMAQIEQIYQLRGTPLAEAGRAAMNTWLAQHPQHKHGRHVYDLATYGLTEQAILDLFAEN
jgi:hypothetical protein